MNINICTYMYIYLYFHIYIYISAIVGSWLNFTKSDIHIYVYIYIYVYIHLYIYICIYRVKAPIRRMCTIKTIKDVFTYNMPISL